MEISKHICFKPHEVPTLVHYLRNNKVPFEDDEGLSVLDIYESSIHWPYIEKQVRSANLFCLSETIYSTEELRNAQWLSIRSQWRFGYPQPEDDFKYESITYTRRNWCPQCSSGLEQINPFRIKKVPKWGQRHFAELNWVGDELFVDDTAQVALTQAGTSGISFLEVCNKKGADIFRNIRQIQVERTLDMGLQTDGVSIREMLYCPKCGISKFVLSGIGMLSFRKEVFENQPDFVKTREFFGSGHYAARIILVRQKVYQTIIENGLGRGLVFEPVELV